MHQQPPKTPSFSSTSLANARSEEHTSELQSHSDLHSFPTRRSSDLAFPVQRRVAAVIRMKAHAPATPEDAVILLDQPGERIPARLIESLNRVPGFHHQLS